MYVFFYLVCEAISTAATPGLLCQPWMIVKMIVEKQMECRLAGENLPQRHFCPSQNPTWPDQSLHPGRRGGKPASNRLSYGAAYMYGYNKVYNYYFLTKYLTNSIQPSPSWEDTRRSAAHEFPTY
jgi:hypothetical protein